MSVLLSDRLSLSAVLARLPFDGFKSNLMGILGKSVDKIQIWLKSHKVIGNLHEDLGTLYRSRRY